MERLIKPEFVDPMGSQATDFKDNVSFLKFFDFQCLDPDWERPQTTMFLKFQVEIN